MPNDEFSGSAATYTLPLARGRRLNPLQRRLDERGVLWELLGGGSALLVPRALWRLS